MLDGFLGTLLVLNDGLWLRERLVLELECLGHFWKLVADFVLLCPERAFCVKICLTAREKRRRGFDDFCVGICREVLVKRAGVAEIGEFSVVSAVSSGVLSLSKGISGF
jgi:hypothetical protein